MAQSLFWNALAICCTFKVLSQAKATEIDPKIHHNYTGAPDFVKAGNPPESIA